MRLIFVILQYNELSSYVSNKLIKSIKQFS